MGVETLCAVNMPRLLIPDRGLQAVLTKKEQDAEMAELGRSTVDIRRASEQLSVEELKFFSGNGSLIELFSPATPIVPTGLWRRCPRHCQISNRATAYRNVLGVSVSFWAAFSTMVVLAGLQSSLNADQGLGLATLVLANLVVAVSVFLSAPAVTMLGTKRGMIAGYVGFLVFALANYYPSWYTLIPGAIAVGFSLGALIWTSIYCHVTAVAVKSAVVLGEDPRYLMALFTGVLTFFYKVGYLPGNLISSIVLFNNGVERSSVVGDNGTCTSTEVANLDKIYVYIMLSLFVVFSLVGIVIPVLFVDEIRTDKKVLTPSDYVALHVKKPVKEMFRVLLNWKMLLMAPIIVYDTLVVSFIIGLYTKVCNMKQYLTGNTV